MRRTTSKSKEIPLIVRFKRLEQLVAKKKEMNKCKSRLPTDRFKELFDNKQSWLPKPTLECKPADGDSKVDITADLGVRLRKADQTETIKAAGVKLNTSATVTREEPLMTKQGRIIETLAESGITSVPSKTHETSARGQLGGFESKEPKKQNFFRTNLIQNIGDMFGSLMQNQSGILNQS